MAIEVFTQRGKASYNELDLNVQIAGNSVIVHAGQFWLAGDAFVLDDALEYVFTPDSSQDLHVNGYLVREASSGTIQLLVDVLSPGDLAFRWKEQTEYRNLYSLFSIKVSAGLDLAEGEGTLAKIEGLSEPDRAPRVKVGDHV